jgi:hypothetical protein
MNHTQHIRAQKTAAGMSRFYSQTNLNRYRKLARGAIGVAEQRQLLKDLAEEMNAFRREIRWAAVDQPLHSREARALGLVSYDS